MSTLETTPPTVARWEYVTVPVLAAGFEDAAGIEGYHAILNQYGQLGWELAGVTSYPSQSVGGWIVVFGFKRVCMDAAARRLEAIPSGAAH